MGTGQPARGYRCAVDRAQICYHAFNQVYTEDEIIGAYKI